MEVRLLSARLLPRFGLSIVMIIVGLVNLQAAVVGSMLVALFVLIPFPLRNRRGLRGTPGAASS